MPGKVTMAINCFKEFSYIFNKFFQEKIMRVSDSLDSDHALQNIWPEIGPNNFAKIINRWNLQAKIGQIKKELCLGKPNPT